MESADFRASVDIPVNIVCAPGVNLAACASHYSLVSQHNRANVDESMVLIGYLTRQGNASLGNSMSGLYLRNFLTDFVPVNATLFLKPRAGCSSNRTDQASERCESCSATGCSVSGRFHNNRIFIVAMMAQYMRTLF